MSLMTGDAFLQVRGRRPVRVMTTLARPVTVGDHRYIVSIRGDTQWSRNLRVAGEALLREKGRTTRIRPTEVHADEQVVRVHVAHHLRSLRRDWIRYSADLNRPSISCEGPVSACR